LFGIRCLVLACRIPSTLSPSRWALLRSTLDRLQMSIPQGTTEDLATDGPATTSEADARYSAAPPTLHTEPDKHVPTFLGVQEFSQTLDAVVG
jgi:hypothetical protein